MHRRTLFIVIVILCTHFSLPILNLESSTANISTIQPINTLVLAYDEHPPIDITSDEDFLAQKENEGWLGNGSKSSPFRIENYNITYRGYNIRIANVTAYFEITNCYLASNASGVKTHPYDDGVGLFNVTHGSIMNNVMVNNEDGGFYTEFSNCSIFNNTMERNRLGVILVNSTGSVISNEISGSNGVSILILDCFDCEVTSNYVSPVSGRAVVINRSFGFRVTHNFLQNQPVSFLSCRNFNVSYNRLIDGAYFDIETSSSMIVSNNIIIRPYRNGITVRSTNRSMISCNQIIEAEIDGILALDSEDCSYVGNMIFGSQDGIEIVNGDTSTFLYNHITNQQHYGIRIHNGSDNLLYGNLLTNDGEGPAADWGNNNNWDDGVFIGNFWEDINPGVLEVFGEAESRDHFARSIGEIEVSFPSICTEPLVDIIDYSGAVISWIIWSSPFFYDININGSTLVTGYNEGSGCVSLNISGLQDGFYTFELVIFPVDMIIDPPFASLPFNVTIPSIWIKDSDSDLMPDFWENENGLNPFVDDSGWDADSDGLFNLDEYFLGTDPQNPDSDFDSIFDGWEVRYGLDPLNALDALLDFDSDTLTNLQEFELGTDPTNSDSDSDTYLDAWEVRFGFDPTNPEVPPTELLVYYTPSIAGVAIAIAAAYILKLRIDLYYEKKQLMKEAERAEKTREAFEELNSSRPSKRDNGS